MVKMSDRVEGAMVAPAIPMMARLAMSISGLVENAASLALHERAGFRRLGVHERFGKDASGRWRDVVFLERRSTSVGT